MFVRWKYSTGRGERTAVVLNSCMLRKKKNAANFVYKVCRYERILTHKPNTTVRHRPLRRSYFAVCFQHLSAIHIVKRKQYKAKKKALYLSISQNSLSLRFSSVPFRSVSFRSVPLPLPLPFRSIPCLVPVPVPVHDPPPPPLSPRSRPKTNRVETNQNQTISRTHFNCGFNVSITILHSLLL